MGNLNAQKVMISLDSPKMLIGDYVPLKINITTQSLDSIQSPILNDAIIAPFEIIAQGKTDTLKIGNEFAIIQNYTLICFKTGQVFFPSLTYHLQGKIILTDSIPLQVETIKLDTTGQLKPIKGPIQVPLTLKEILPYFYWVLLGGILILIFWWLYRKYFAKKEIVTEEKIIEPPHIIALKKLRAIEDEKLWQHDRIKEYYIKVSDTIREYIENRYSIHALEQTTDELIISLKRVRVNATNRAKIERILSLADLAKFAKTQPLSNENVESMHLSIEFIEKTKQNIELEERRNSANMLQNKFYGRNEYKLVINSQAKFIKSIIITAILAALLIPMAFILIVYGLNIFPLIIFITNYGMMLSLGFLLLLIGFFYMIYRNKKSHLEQYRLIFSSSGITERIKGKNDKHFTNEQIRSITENKKGEMIIYTTDIHQKIMISNFIEHRDEVKERLTQIMPVEFV